MLSELELYPPTADVKQFAGTWDNMRFVRALIELASRSAIGIETEDLELAVKQLRLYSAFCAFTGCEWDGDIDDCISELYEIRAGHRELEYSDEDIAYYKNLAARHKMFANPNLDKNTLGHYIIRTIQMILKSRVAIERALSCYSGILECSPAHSLGIFLAQDIYDPVLRKCNEEADTVLASLLGYKFKRVITEQELIKKFHYPTVTDKELEDYMLDI